MLLFALAIAPGFAICLLIYFRYRHYKEPVEWLLLAFLLGMASTLPAMLVQYLSGDTRENTSAHFILSYAFFAYIVVAFSEELSKFLALRLYAYPKKSFGEPFNGIVYSVMIGMGFATVENIEYVYRFGFQTGVTRFFLSVPAHASFAVLMGYFMGLAKLSTSGRPWLMIKGLLIAVFFHGTYDFCLFLQQNEKVTETVSTGLLSFGSFASYYIAVRLAMRSIRLHEAGNATKNE
jgi:protease PrsW